MMLLPFGKAKIEIFVVSCYLMEPSSFVLCLALLCLDIRIVLH